MEGWENWGKVESWGSEEEGWWLREGILSMELFDLFQARKNWDLSNEGF